VVELVDVEVVVVTAVVLVFEVVPVEFDEVVDEVVVGVVDVLEDVAVVELVVEVVEIVEVEDVVEDDVVVVFVISCPIMNVNCSWLFSSLSSGI
jgi:hypothetical protein